MKIESFWDSKTYPKNEAGSFFRVVLDLYIDVI